MNRSQAKKVIERLEELKKAQDTETNKKNNDQLSLDFTESYFPDNQRKSQSGQGHSHVP